jgi:hypothetical protein
LCEEYNSGLAKKFIQIPGVFGFMLRASCGWGFMLIGLHADGASC